MSAELSPVVAPAQIRQKILTGYDREAPPCVVDLAQYASDTSFHGFEDPRSAALHSLGTSTSSRSDPILCERRGCDAAANINYYGDTLGFTGSCALSDTCTKEAWESEDHTSPRDVSLQRASSEILSFTCVRAGCDYNCGYTIEGSQGEGGTCQRNV
jgi:hypothetical protein